MLRKDREVVQEMAATLQGNTNISVTMIGVFLVKFESDDLLDNNMRHIITLNDLMQTSAKDTRIYVLSTETKLFIKEMLQLMLIMLLLLLMSPNIVLASINATTEHLHLFLMCIQCSVTCFLRKCSKQNRWLSLKSHDLGLKPQDKIDLVFDRHFFSLMVLCARVPKNHNLYY